MALFSKTKALLSIFKKVEASPLVERLILPSWKQQGEDIITMMKTEDKLIFLYKTGYIFGQPLG